MIARITARQLQAAIDVLFGGVADHFVQEARHLAHVAGCFRESLLVCIELLEHDHRQIDVVLLEAEYRSGIVHEHVGIEHKQAVPVAGPGLQIA